MNENKKITIPLPPPVEYVINTLHQAGFSAYAVGGCVRDHLMGRVPGDYDVTTNALPEDMLRVFSSDRVVETGLKHGTLTVVRDGENIETTTYRIDGTYDDGRHPDSVTFTDKLSEDLMRRDFTVNAMAYSPANGLVDLYGGQNDLHCRIIRTVGKASDRFSEDGLRILRALRFASTLGFTLDDECADAVRSLSPLLAKISRERIWTELSKLVVGRDAGDVLSAFPDVISSVIPPTRENDIIRAAREISYCAKKHPDITDRCLALSFILRGLSEEDAVNVINSLKTSREEKNAVLAVLKKESFFTEIDSYTVKKLISQTSDEFPARLAAFLEATGALPPEEAENITRLAAGAVQNGECRCLSLLAVSGSDLIPLGYKGREIGEALEYLLDCVMRGECANEKAALLARLSRQAGGVT